MPATSQVAPDQKLERYGDLTVQVALNLQPGQRLLIIGPLMNGGVSLEAAPLVRHIAASAYRAGAELVDAVLSVYANDPDLLQHESTDLAGALQQATSRSMIPFRELISRNQTNWSVIATAGAAWAAKVFPEAPTDQRLSLLRDSIERLCRLDRPDPVAAWQQHIAALAARSDFLNRKHYTALRFSGPGTDLTVGLPEAHLWVSGASPSRNNIRFVANLPTEEVFTIADRQRVSGTVRATKPLSYSGTLIEDFSLTFDEGRVIDVKAGAFHIIRAV